MQTIAPSVLFPVFNSPYPQGTQLYLNEPNFSFGQDAKIAHFIGASKPWHIQLDLAGELVSGSGGEHTSKHLTYWWQIFHDVAVDRAAERDVGGRDGSDGGDGGGGENSGGGGENSSGGGNNNEPRIDIQCCRV